MINDHDYSGLYPHHNDIQLEVGQKCNLVTVPAPGEEFLIKSLNINGIHKVVSIEFSEHCKKILGFTTRIEETDDRFGIDAYVSFKDYKDYGIYPIPKAESVDNRKKESNMTHPDPDLSNLSHNTLVQHTINLQSDYDNQNSELLSIGEDYYALNDEMDQIDDQLEELQTKLYASEQKCKDQVRIKNNHIDKHIESSRRANEADVRAKMLEGTVNEVSGLLRDEVLNADDMNFKLQATQSQVDLLRRKNRKLKKQLEPEQLRLESIERSKLSDLRYTTIQTIIRWGCTAGTIGWAFYIIV